MILFKSDWISFLAFKVAFILSTILYFVTPFPFGNSGPLYGPNDFVYILNSSTIQQNIFNSERAWLVEFYSSWCGHCISFAPKWKKLAEDIKEWRSLVVIAGIDCADDKNVPSCREFDIFGYPTLKMFPNNANSNMKDSDGKEVLNVGTVFRRPESMTKLKTDLMETLTSFYPKLLGPSDSLAKNLATPAAFWKDSEFSKGPPFLLLIYESTKSNVGLEVTLRLSRYKDSIRVLRFHEKNPIYTNLGLSDWPSAAYLTKDGVAHRIILNKNQDIVQLLTTTTIELAKITKIEEKPEVETMAQENTDENNRLENSLPPPNSEDKVSMEDLLHTVRNLLRNEVGLLQRIDGTKLGALKNLLGVLTQYFPSDRREVQIFLVKLADWIRPQRDIQNYNYLEKLNELESEMNPWDIDMNIWYDCRATIPGRRGYSCGLWRLFHTLTMIALEKNENAPVLTAIQGYVQEFFGCRECSNHFGKMVERDNALQLHSIREQTIWLWKAHNEVNLRLKNTPSEDPAYPKSSYPTLKLCSTCYDPSTAFDETKVEEYLLKIYSRPERYLDRMSSNVGKVSFNSTDQRLRSRNTSTSWDAGYFSFTDIGIFVLLYLSIILLLVFAYIHFKIARRRRYDPIFCLHRIWSRGH